jgi:hypothetical protein
MKSLLASVASAAFFVAPAFAAGTPINAPEPVVCPYGTWEMVEQALTMGGYEFVRVEFAEAFGVSFASFKAAVFVHQTGGLAMGREGHDGCMSAPLSIAPELPRA